MTDAELRQAFSRAAPVRWRGMDFAQITTLRYTRMTDGTVRVSAELTEERSGKFALYIAKADEIEETGGKT